jgi:hypothetical protein
MPPASEDNLVAILGRSKVGAYPYFAKNLGKIGLLAPPAKVSEPPDGSANVIIQQLEPKVEVSDAKAGVLVAPVEPAEANPSPANLPVQPTNRFSALAESPVGLLNPTIRLSDSHPRLSKPPVRVAGTRFSVASRSEAVAAGEDAILDFTEAVEEKVVVGDGFFDELLEQENLGAVDDGVDAVFEGFHRREGLE